MGSNSFVTEYIGTASVEDAYRQMCDDALSEYGHNAYNGTISTTSGVHVVQATPVSRDEAHRIVEEQIDNYSKWSDCGAIALLPRGEQREVDVEVTHKPGDDVEALLAKAVLRKGEHLAQWYAVGLPNRVMRAPQVTVPAAKAVTVYNVTNEYGQVIIKGCQTQAEARAKAVARAKEGNTTEAMFVRAEVVRETGEALVRIDPVVARSTQTYHVIIEGPAPSKAHGGWLFFGWAAS